MSHFRKFSMVSIFLSSLAVISLVVSLTCVFLTRPADRLEESNLPSLLLKEGDYQMLENDDSLSIDDGRLMLEKISNDEYQNSTDKANLFGDPSSNLNYFRISLELTSSERHYSPSFMFSGGKITYDFVMTIDDSTYEGTIVPLARSSNNEASVIRLLFSNFSLTFLEENL